MKSSAWVFAMALVLAAGLTGGAVYTSATETGAQLPAVGYDEDGRPFARPGRMTVILERRTAAWDAAHTHFSLLPGTPPGTYGPNGRRSGRSGGRSD